MNNFDPKMIAKMRQLVPDMIARELISVQPIADELFINVIEAAKKFEENYIPHNGDKRHVFGMCHWEVYYNGSWISEDIYNIIKANEHI